MKTLITSGVAESKFWLYTNTEDANDSRREEKWIHAESEVLIIESIIETIVEPIIYKC